MNVALGEADQSPMKPMNSNLLLLKGLAYGILFSLKLECITALITRKESLQYCPQTVVVNLTDFYSTII